MSSRVAIGLRELTVLTSLMLAMSSVANARSASINYDNLSFLEEPLAAELMGFTLRYSHIFDVPVSIDFDENHESLEAVSLFEVNIEQQLSNAITIGASYSGLFDSSHDDDEKYTDTWAVYAGGVWGTGYVGDVTGQVHELTRRFRGVGNADLAFDNLLGKPDSIGLAYAGRQSAFALSAAVDKAGYYDVGLSYRRPSKYIDHHVTLRHVHGTFDAADRTGPIETMGYSVVGEIVYGSMLIDLGGGYETFDGALDGEERYYVSGGISYKYNAASLSVEGHLGEVAGYQEFSYSVGGRLDIARGASLNIGYNYSELDAPFVEDHGKTTKMQISLRYEY